MADLIHNNALGKFVHWAELVEAGAANEALVVVVFDNDGSSTDDNVRDADDVAAIEALTGVSELNTNGWERKVLDDTDVTVTISDADNWVDVDIPDQTWTAVSGGSGNASTDLEVGFDNDSTAGTDGDIAAATWHDFAVTPDGSDVTAQIPTAGFYRSQQQ